MNLWMDKASLLAAGKHSEWRGNQWTVRPWTEKSEWLPVSLSHSWVTVGSYPWSRLWVTSSMAKFRNLIQKSSLGRLDKKYLPPIKTQYLDNPNIFCKAMRNTWKSFESFPRTIPSEFRKINTIKSKSTSLRQNVSWKQILLGISPPFYHKFSDQLYISGASPSLRGLGTVMFFVPNILTPKKAEE